MKKKKRGDHEKILCHFCASCKRRKNSSLISSACVFVLYDFTKRWNFDRRSQNIILFYFFQLGAVFCMIYKRVTDDEANKLFYFLQKFSREWPLLNNVTWEENGAIFADITYGSYIIIVIGLIIGQCSGELQRCRKLVNPTCIHRRLVKLCHCCTAV